MFPGANAQVYYNEAGEVLGWDYPSDEPYEMDDYEMANAPDICDEYKEAEESDHCIRCGAPADYHEEAD